MTSEPVGVESGVVGREEGQATTAGMKGMSVRELQMVCRVQTGCRCELRFIGPTRRLVVAAAASTVVAGTERHNRPAEAKILGPGGSAVGGGQGRRWGHSAPSAPAGAPGRRPTGRNCGRGALHPTLTRSGGGGRRVDGGGLGHGARPGTVESPVHRCGTIGWCGHNAPLVCMRNQRSAAGAQAFQRRCWTAHWGQTAATGMA